MSSTTDWERLAVECEQIRDTFDVNITCKLIHPQYMKLRLAQQISRARRVEVFVQQRIKQRFFAAPS